MNLVDCKLTVKRVYADKAGLDIDRSNSLSYNFLKQIRGQNKLVRFESKLIVNENVAYTSHDSSYYFNPFTFT